MCVIGLTGAGKSTFCHMICGSDPRFENVKFQVSDSAASCTMKIEANVMPWFDGRGEVLLIDCPGLMDSKNRDH